MSKLLRQYDNISNIILDSAKQEGKYVVLRFHQHDFFEAEYKVGNIYKARNDIDVGCGMYVFTKSGHVGFGSTNDLSDESVTQLYNRLASIAETNAKAGLATAAEIYDLPKQPNIGQDDLHYMHFDAADIDIVELDQKLSVIHNELMAIDKTLTSLIRFNFELDQWRIIRSDGTDVDWSNPKTRLMVQMTLKKGSASSSAAARFFDTTPTELFKGINLYTKDLKHAYKLLKDQITADSIKAGHYPLVLDSNLVGMIAHEALGHPAESDAVATNNSVLATNQGRYKAGDEVASPIVSIIDHEPNLTHGFHPYGAFGNARQPVTIIDRGVLRESISDVFTASKTGVENKNCERSEGYWAPAIPRMSNTYVSVSDTKEADTTEFDHSNSPKALQALLLKEGILDEHPVVYYLQQMTGGMVNPANGTFMFGTGFVYEVTGDKVVAKQPVSFSGNVLGALKSITAGFGDVIFEPGGYCGKSDQVAHVRDGGNEFIMFAPTDEVTIA
jgi:TldD protein